MLLYAVMVLAYSVSWLLRKDIKPVKDAVNETISVIIAFRNEESNLKSLLDSILTQDYIGDFEVILVDDHSEDKSCEIIKSYTQINIKLLKLQSGVFGKKAALRLGAANATGELLFFTDADCILPNKWLSESVSYLLSNKIDMLCGPVEFIEGNGVLSKLFELEFLSLTASGAAGIFLKMPFMCNGANYAIRKSVFDEASKHFNDKYSSGDDVFLLHHVSKNSSVDFIKSSDCIVQTNAPLNVSGFFTQRIRWASKTTGYKNLSSIISAIIVFFAAVVIICSLVLTIVDFDFLYLFIATVLIKSFADFMFMLPVLRFYKKTKLLWVFPMLQLVYPAYIMLTAILSMVYKPKWKGRRISA
jgi:cellulose synthase/poly-beta-1,6-N-acetylglucosamine synthase-like glycosyltransferase